MTRRELRKIIAEEIAKLKSPRKQVSEAAKEYDLGAGYKGNGLTVWNRAEEVHGDYKTIAHVSEDGTIRFFEKNLPANVRAQIQRWADDERSKYQKRFAFYRYKR